MGLYGSVVPPPRVNSIFVIVISPPVTALYQTCVSDGTHGVASISANNDFRNEPDNPNMSTGWWLQQALCVFNYSGFLVTASFPLVFELTAVFLPVLEFLGSSPQYVQCGCDDHLVVCTTQSSLINPRQSCISPYNGYIYTHVIVRTMAHRN